MLFPEIAYASTFSNLVGKVQLTISQGIIPLIGGAALVFFLWGLVRYLVNADSEPQRKLGREYMVWGLIGLLVLVGTWGFVGLLSALLGADVHIPQFAS
ncbi:MAG TPA: hypothetical protein VJJ47_00565 [Candidatus Paceibacterota bacterium]